MSDWVTVTRADDVPAGAGASVLVDGRTIAVFNVEGTLYAIEGVCLHRGGPVGEGDLEGCVVTCPWHGWQYDVTTGRNVFDPSIGLRTYEVRVEAGVIEVSSGPRGRP